MALVLTTKQ